MGGQATAGRAEQAVDHLVHRPVAAVHDHHVDAVGGGPGRDLGGVPGVIGVLDGEADAALERVGQQVAAGGRGGGGIGIHDEHGTHEPPA